MSTDSDAARLDAMEKKITDLTSRLDNTSCDSPPPASTKKKKKTGEKRAPTVYNNFMKDHISNAKAQFDDADGKFDHKKAFSAAAAAWSKDHPKTKSKSDKKEPSE